ncbi:MAG TPA: hypothetical protein VGD65_07445 [Chryseosolibacter sp.]
MNPKKYLHVAGLLFLLACDGTEPSTEIFIDLVTGQPSNVGYRPVYGEQEYSEVSWTMPQTITKPGKIYVYGKYLLINEARQGIHVYDNSNPQAPTAVGFLRILGNTDMAIKDGVLYADHMGNLVALTISDFTAVQEKGRLELANWNLGVPPPRGARFECVDPAKGIVVSWKKVESENLKCYAIR